MIEASMVGIVRTILIIAGIIFIIRLLRRVLSPPPRKGGEGQTQKTKSRFTRGNTVVERVKDPKRTGPDNDGDYVDFEVIEDE